MPCNRLALAVLCACSVALSLAATPAYGWGDLGHEIICEIAFQEMSPKARDTVQRLLRRDRAYELFSKACSWPDHPRKRAAEHFVNLPRAWTTIERAQCPLADECLFTAIATDVKVLEKRRARERKKLEALKYLGHWIGDLHQPLHVSFADDRGGNRIDVQGGPCENLHAVWDSCLIVENFGRDSLAVAGQLRRGLTAEKRTRFRAGDVVTWADESYRIATAPATGYCTRGAGGCLYAADNPELEPGETARTEVVDQEYVEGRKEVVAGQLLKAGLRLASLLDRILGSTSPP